MTNSLILHSFIDWVIELCSWNLLRLICVHHLSANEIYEVNSGLTATLFTSLLTYLFTCLLTYLFTCVRSFHWVLSKEQLNRPITAYFENSLSCISSSLLFRSIGQHIGCLFRSSIYCRASDNFTLKLSAAQYSCIFVNAARCTHCIVWKHAWW